MIKAIELYNFQSHKKTVLEMDKLTVLTGGSNSGKSAVLRALGGLLRNDSVGDYVSHGEKNLRVSIIMDDGYIVDWEKGTGLNQYKITSPNGEEDLYQKVGSDIPEEVASVIGIAPITMEGGQKLHINLHEQLETPFLVGKEHTAGFTAKVFGEVTSAAKLQASIQEGNRLIRVDLNKTKLKRSDLSDLDEKLLQFSDLELQKKFLHEAENSFEKAKSAESKKESLETIFQTFESLTSDLFLFSKRVDELKPVEKINLDKAVAKAEEIKALRSILDEIALIDQKVEQLSGWEVLISKANCDDLLEKAQNKLNSTESLSSALYDINTISNEMSEFDGFIEKTTSSLTKLDAEIDELMAELDECPTCRQELSTDAKAHLLGAHVV